jgi:taurine dioxygenase
MTTTGAVRWYVEAKGQKTVVTYDFDPSTSEAEALLRVRRLNGTFGARIDDVDLSQPLAPETRDAIRLLLATYKVLVFPGQTSLSAAGLMTLAVNFGEPELESHPTWPHYPGVPGVLVMKDEGEGRFETWHVDGSTRSVPSWISMLHAIDVPSYGRDTLFVDSEAIFDSLSPTLQQFLEGCMAEHVWPNGIDRPSVEWPVISTNPITNRKRLYVNRGYTSRIIGLSRPESEHLLSYLYQQVNVPEFQLRVSWQNWDLVIWDNESTQHALVRDVSYPRVMHRVMVSPGADKRTG